MRGAASAYMLNGANFVVTPVLREDIAMVCNRRKVSVVSGLRLTHRDCKGGGTGLRDCEVIPGKHLWPRLCKRRAGTPTMDKYHAHRRRISPTEENLKGWFDAGVTCVGMGSKLMAKHADGSFDYANN